MKKSKNIRKTSYIFIIVITAIISLSCIFYYYTDRFINETEARYLEFSQAVQPGTVFVDLITVYCNNYLSDNNYNNVDNPLFSHFTYSAKNDSFSLDSLAGTQSENITGNLTGDGQIPSLSQEKSEINMILSCNPFFSSIRDKLKNIEWINYTSAQDFTYIYPFTPSSRFRYTLLCKDLPFYMPMIPSNNPEKTAKWSHVYNDAGGKGLIVSYSSPIYEKDTFAGVLSIDFTTNKLSNLLSSTYESYLYDASGSIITANNLTNYRYEKTSIQDLLGFSEADTRKLSNLGDHHITFINGSFYYKCDFHSAPWTMIERVSFFRIFLGFF